MKKRLMQKIYFSASTITLALIWPGISLGYFDKYPPYEFKGARPQAFTIKLLVDLKTSTYKSKDGKIIARLREGRRSLDFYLKEDSCTLVRMHQQVMPMPCAVYRADLDRNGLNDFIVIYNYRDPGLGIFNDRVEIYLKQGKHQYKKIAYDTMRAGSEDFVDISNDGKCEVIITGFYGGGRHNYFTYSIYEFMNSSLINADVKFRGFPKFIMYTYKDNDKDATQLTPTERMRHTEEKNNAIEVEKIR